MTPPDYLHIDNSTVTTHIDQAAQHIEDFIHDYSDTLKSHLPFFIFLAVYL
jgi:hypothetical protein